MVMKLPGAIQGYLQLSLHWRLRHWHMQLLHLSSCITLPTALLSTGRWLPQTLRWHPRPVTLSARLPIEPWAACSVDARRGLGVIINGKLRLSLQPLRLLLELLQLVLDASDHVRLRMSLGPAVQWHPGWCASPRLTFIMGVSTQDVATCIATPWPLGWTCSAS